MPRFGGIHNQPQEKLAKDDIRLLISVLQRLELVNDRTRIELLIGKLKRMEKQ